jgi:GntR family transcriptional regulator/MocR family aminotransferase
MSRMRTSSALELLVPLDRDESAPLHRQLERRLRDGVREGRLAQGSLLPSTRALSRELGISRGIVVEAYEQLAAEGYLASRPGGTTRVARSAAPAPVRSPEPETIPILYDFRPGRPDVSQFPRDAWLRSIRRVFNEAPSDRLGYLDGRGMPELRDALAAYLNRVRGTAADGAGMIISSGFTQGMLLVSRVLAASGARRIGVEEPSQSDARRTIRDCGLESVGIPVDDAGIRVDVLDRTEVDAVLVTPAHQYPTGAVLPAERRAALAAWATRSGRLIIEDDYDAEFRYDREPIGAIQGLSPDNVVYIGSASKILAPGLRLGWLVVPPSLVDAIAKEKKVVDLGSSAIDQLAVADILSRGELDRHLRRLRPIYRRRRDAILGAIARYLPELRPVGASAGLHVLVWLPDDVDEAALVREASAAGIGLEGAASSGTVPNPRAGIIFGYGSADERTIDEGVRRLAAVLASVRADGRPVAVGATAGSARPPLPGGPPPRPDRARPPVAPHAGEGGRRSGRARP